MDGGPGRCLSSQDVEAGSEQLRQAAHGRGDFRVRRRATRPDEQRSVRTEFQACETSVGPRRPIRRFPCVRFSRGSGWATSTIRRDGPIRGRGHLWTGRPDGFTDSSENVIRKILSGHASMEITTRRPLGLLRAARPPYSFGSPSWRRRQPITMPEMAVPVRRTGIGLAGRIFTPTTDWKRERSPSGSFSCCG
jgi:hypothetical protein